jgi:hypothetical protein
MSTAPTQVRRRPPLAAMLLVPVAAALVLTLFAWPQARMKPHDLPVGVAGPPAATAQIAHELDAQDGAFEVHRYAGEAAARAGIADREIYGAAVVTPTGREVLTASAASPTVAQMITNATRASAHASSVEVKDVAPAQRVSALSACILPLILAGSLTAFVSGLLATGLRRAALIVGASACVGMAAALIIENWLDVVDGHWIANAGVLGLTVLAVAATVAGLESLLGRLGTGIAAMTMILVGNPFAAVASGPEMLPTPVGAIGQLMPPGAGANLLRSTGYFDGAAGAGHAAVLGAWALAGVGALLLAGARGRRLASRPAAVPA